jgi:hypothetical protein
VAPTAAERTGCRIAVELSDSAHKAAAKTDLHPPVIEIFAGLLVRLLHVLLHLLAFVQSHALHPSLDGQRDAQSGHLHFG